MCSMLAPNGLMEPDCSLQILGRLTGLMNHKPCTESMLSPPRTTLMRTQCKHPFVW